MRAADPVMTLTCHASEHITLDVLVGRLWLTRHDSPEDWFIEAGQRFAAKGPARLYIGADGSQAMRLHCSRHTARPDA
ncbi:DUF2917 domain-containing protein [Ottowia sp.]|uniref:DUF2917 domain-containing protein n=1 Tax=Ottowia sp. TaxID=1898956 RepID=UPI003A86DE6F